LVVKGISPSFDEGDWKNLRAARVFWAARLLRAKETTSCLWAKKKKMRLAAPEVQA
jgi:hypothetical protein